MHAKVVMTGHGRGELWIDGQKVEKVRGIALKVGVGEQNILSVEYTPDEIDVEGQFDVTTIEHDSRVWKFQIRKPGWFKRLFWGLA
jgi:hypothetical protein